MSPLPGISQIKIKIENGALHIIDGAIFFQPVRYKAKADSLDALIKMRKADTAILFERALLYDLSNNVLAKPFAADKAAFENLLKAESLVKEALHKKMHGFDLKVLQAQVYHDLAYRFSGDESWRFTPAQINQRRELFDYYKAQANKLYGDLALLDPDNSYDYKKLFVVNNYPIHSK